MIAAVPNQIVVYNATLRRGGDLALARVDLVRPRHYTVLPWNIAQREFARGRVKLDRSRVIRVLPSDTDPVALGVQFNINMNRRDAEIAVCVERYRQRNSWLLEQEYA